MHKTTLIAAYIAAALAACIHSGQPAAPAPSTTYPLAGVVTTAPPISSPSAPAPATCTA